MRAPRKYLVLLLLLTAAFTLATSLQPQALNWTRRTQPESVLKILLGDSRRMFANQLFVQADISFHSGYYPSIFEEARRAEERDSDVSHPHEDEGKQLEKGFLGPPLDWVDRFGRHFRPVIHTHLHGLKIGEILPWLSFSADLNPHQIETYMVAAYWLEQMGKPEEGVRFVRKGLGNNPGNPALLYELGWLFFEDLHDAPHARNVWLAALRRWHQVEAPKEQPDKRLLREILGGLVRVEAAADRPKQAVKYLEELKTVSPDPKAVQQLIDDIERKTSGKSTTSSKP